VEVKMRALVIERSERRGLFAIAHVDEPTCGPGDVLIKVRAAGLNRADLLSRDGAYTANKTLASGELRRVGMEAAGVIEQLGDGVSGFSLGQRVMVMSGGTFAERLAVDQRLAMPVPDNLDWSEAAAIPMAAATEFDALVTQGNLKAGQSVLILGASSGVGVLGAQIARWKGAQPVIGTTTSAEKLSALTEFGVGIAVNTHTTNLIEAVMAATGGHGVDLTIDHVGGELLNQAVAAAAIRGTIIQVGRIGGKRLDFDLETLAYRRVRLIGTTFRTRSPEEVYAVAERIRQHVVPAMEDDRLKPVVSRVFPFEQFAEAFDFMENNRALGKIVLSFV
jgi:NADPH2:quinone reductase